MIHRSASTSHHSTCRRNRRGRRWHRLQGSNPSTLDAPGDGRQDRMWWICKGGQRLEGDATHSDHIDKRRSGRNSSKDFEWPDPVDAELLRGGVQGGHVLGHPVILEHVKQRGFACIVQPWKELFQLKIQGRYDEDSKSHLGREVCQTSSKVRGNPERPWTSPRETSCQLSLSPNITSYICKWNGFEIRKLHWLTRLFKLARK